MAIGAAIGGSSASNTNCPWFNADLVTVAQSTGTNGAAIISDTGVTYDHTGGTVENMFSKAGIGAGVIVGMYTRVTGTNITTGYYEVTTVAGDDSYIACSGITATGDCDSTIDVGGAVPAVDATYDLQDVLDDTTIGSAASQDVYIYVTDGTNDGSSSYQIDAQIDIDVGGGVGFYRKFLIGSDTSYAELGQGEYCEFNDDADTAAGDIFEITVANITFKHIEASAPAGSGGTPGSTEYCFDSPSGGDDLVFEDCYAERGYRCYSLAAGTGHLLLNCRSKDNLQYAVFLNNAHGAAIIGGEYIWGSAFSELTLPVIRADGSSGLRVSNVVVAGGQWGLEYDGPYGFNITNCLFYSQSVYAVYMDDAGSHLYAINNIFYLDSGSADYAIYFNTNSKLYEDYNITNCDATHAIYVNAAGRDWVGSNSISNLTFTSSDPITDPANNDYKPNRGQTIADANVIGKGWIPFWNALTGENPNLSIGPFPTYDLPAVSNVDSSDTVFGVTGTASGGGGGIITHPGMDGGIKG